MDNVFKTNNQPEQRNHTTYFGPLDLSSDVNRLEMYRHM
jgi:hypothetical protein